MEPRHWPGCDRGVQALTEGPGRGRVCRRVLSSGVAVVIFLIASVLAGAPTPAFAAPDASLNASAPCAVLARQSLTATNGSQWGETILAGHGAPGGWFGVDVCSNGINTVSPNGSNVSCSRVPANWSRTGCAPGAPTSDGFGWTFQCPELVLRFSAWAFGDSPGAWGRSGYGNAPDLWLPANHPADFVMYPNGSSTPPVAGDILVWGSVNANGQPWPAGPNGQHGGHIAVVASVRNGVVTTAEENVKWGTQDHPTDSLALIHVGSRWILSGSTKPQTTLPAYRWRATMGTSRATYGWLHNVRNTGVFPSRSSGTSNSGTSTHGPIPPAAKTPAPTTPTPAATPAPAAAPQQTTSVLPSLAPATLVVSGGSLADLAWSNGDRFAVPYGSSPPHAQIRDLGAPPGASLQGDQAPATVTLLSGARYTYAVGIDGHLYAAYTAPGLLGVAWTDLGTPPSLTLRPPASATAFAGGIAVAAIATDGTLWWRAGPQGLPGGWQALGRPASAALAGGFAIVGVPGVGSPAALAIGDDGLLYERVWQSALLNPDGSVQVAAGWSDWISVRAQPSGIRWTGKLTAVTEAVDVHNWIGTWPDAPLDVLALDTSGQLWRLRSAAGAVSWKVDSIHASQALTALIAATVVPAVPLVAPTSGAAASPAPTAPDESVAQPADELHVYALAGQAPLQAVVPVPPDASQPASILPTWTGLSTLPPDASTSPVGVALSLGPASSTLLLAGSNGLRVGGSPDGIHLLLPEASASSADGAAADAWPSLGAISTGGSAGDPLTASTLSAEWSPHGAGAETRASASGVDLVPGGAGVAALLQSAAPGNVAISVQLALPARLGPDVKSGLVLYLDDGDWITLLVDGSGQAALCAMSAQKAAPCTPMPTLLSPSTRTLWLRIERRGTLYSGATSLDGMIWHSAGQWLASLPQVTPGAGDTTATATPGSTRSAGVATAGTPAATQGPAPTPTPTIAPGPAPTSTIMPGTAPSGVTASADPVAPLAFTEWGIWTQGTPGEDVGVHFSALVISSLPAGAP